MIRVLVAEDSVTARMLLVSMLSSDPGITVVGEARDGEEAIEMTARLRPDLVTMDIHMPRIDGFEATKRIMSSQATPILIVSATLDPGDVAASMEALRAGAVSVFPKPGGPMTPDFENQRTALVSAVKALSQVKLVRRRESPLRRGSHAQGPAALRRPRVLALGASTGGPAALNVVLGALPASLPVPVFVVQHITAGFVDGFVHWLDRACDLRVKTAAQGEPAEAGTVYVAPDGLHLAVGPDGRLDLRLSSPVAGFRPSASVLFESVAETYGSNTLAVILTGMGNDGLLGLRRIRSKGGRIIAQNEDTCAVFGMPGAAVAENLPDAVLPIHGIAAEILRCV
jgi:two-component system chemotaxis response regulator CheB